MKRNKYVNTFNTTSEFDNFIESAEPGFPNVALTKDTGDIHYTRTSPNDHVIYGEVVDVNWEAPTFKFNNFTNVTAHVDSFGMFYIDASDMTGVTSPITSLYTFCWRQNNVKSIKKLDIDKFSNSSNITNLQNSVRECTNLEYVNLSGLNTINVTNMQYMCYGSSVLTKVDLTGWHLTNISNMNFSLTNNSLSDVYITVEETLNKLTNNLSSTSYINSRVTIHYNGTDYKWQNNAWKPQS